MGVRVRYGMGLQRKKAIAPSWQASVYAVVKYVQGGIAPGSAQLEVHAFGVKNLNAQRNVFFRQNGRLQVEREVAQFFMAETGEPAGGFTPQRSQLRQRGEQNGRAGLVGVQAAVDERKGKETACHGSVFAWQAAARGRTCLAATAIHIGGVGVEHVKVFYNGYKPLPK